MEPIGVGDIVESLIDWSDGPDVLVSGALYCVAAVYPDDGSRERAVHCPPCRRGGVGLTRDATHSADDHWAMCSFRPIKRRDESLLKSLLEPANLEMEGA